MSLCKDCNETKAATDFPTYKYQKKDGTAQTYTGKVCYNCKAMKEKERRAVVKDTKKIERASNSKSKMEEPKICNVCKIEKDASEFRIKKDKKNDKIVERLNYCCNDCDNEKSRVRHQKNKETYNETKKKYRQTSEKDKARRVQYRLENKDKHAAYKLQYKINNVGAKLRENFSSRISSIVKKDKHTPSYLGTDMIFVKEWLEYNFNEQFNWENHGKLWHIDHTMPINCFNLKKIDVDTKNELFNLSQELAFNWKNLMPMKAVKNLEKSDKLYPKLILFQELKVKMFAKLHNLDKIEIDNYFKKYSNKFGDELTKFKWRHTS